jgi:3-hydroxyisobutyrate dehydrogenase
MSTNATVALLGAGGTMGLGMGGNIARADIPLRAWNRTREKAEPLAEHGTTIVDTPAQAAEGAAVVITMLPDADAVMEVMDGEDGFLSTASGSLVWAQMSTIGVAGTERCAELAERHGIAFVDAPVLGTKQPAEKGELVVLASGPDEAWEVLEPIFGAVGKGTMWVGAAGTGSRLKVVANSWIVTIAEGVAEAIALAAGADLDPRLFLEAVADGPLDAPYLQMKGQAMIERDFEPSFRLALAAKDAALALELAERHDLDLPLVRTISSRLAEAVTEHGDEDLAATFLTSAPSKS